MLEKTPLTLVKNQYAINGFPKVAFALLQKNTGRCDECHNGLLFPPERF